MKLFYLFLIIAITALNYCAADLPPYCGPDSGDYPKSSGGKLLQVHLVARHGDRIQANAGQCWKGDEHLWDCLLTDAITPTINRDQHYLRVERLYRKVFYTGREEVPGNCALGQLTSIGFKQQLSNGENYRKIYVESGFLSPNFSSVEHRVRSTNMFRTLQSAQGFMTGMFPPSQPVVGRAGIMDINTMDGTYENMYPNDKLCPKSKDYITAYFKSQDFLDHYNSVSKQLVEDLQKALDDETFTYQDIFMLFDCLNVFKCHEVDTPAGITQDLYQRVSEEVTYVFYQMYAYPSPAEAAKVGIGFFIKEVQQEIEAKIAMESKLDFILYSGHDVTLMTLLLAFNVSDGVWPPYASQMIFEVYQMTDNSHTMRILYNGKVMKLPFCDDKELCNTDIVKEYVAKFEPESVAKDCQSSKMRV
ncbi:counting factor 60-like [Dendronephthya gigantea]|uniref:counting factor 60-like n=1 Tax=Dendronephthya gigantea TaxID=151771 RepID=UPI00106A0AA5|nr:counting factor 60-like [Dendronephthya gigantea]